MNKKQQILPELRFPEFMNDGSWNNLQLGKIADVSKLAGYEFTKHIVYENEGEIIALRGLNIKNNRLDLTDVKYIDNSELSKLERSKLYIDDLMFTYIGTIGEVALIEENNKYYLAPNVSRVRVNKEIIFPKFILHHFNTSDFKKIEIAKYVSSSSQPALTMENVRKFLISVPPRIQEQQKIAACLSSLDELITAETEKLHLYQDHKKGLLQKLFPQEGDVTLSGVEGQPKYRFPEFKNDGDWEEVTLGECLDYLQPTPYLVNGTDYNDEYNTPVLTAGKTFILGYTNEKQGVFCDDLPVIIFDDFTTASKFVDFAFKAKSSAMKILLAKDGNNIKFLFEAIQNLKFEVSTHKRHWISVFSKLNILKPLDPKEQQTIAYCLSSVDELIEAQSQKIEDLQAHKKGLLQQLFPNISDVKYE